MHVSVSMSIFIALAQAVCTCMRWWCVCICTAEAFCVLIAFWILQTNHIHTDRSINWKQKTNAHSKHTQNGQRTLKARLQSQSISHSIVRLLVIWNWKKRDNETSDVFVIDHTYQVSSNKCFPFHFASIADRLSSYDAWAKENAYQ